MKATILNLVRFFDKEEYADQFLRGQLRLNRLRHYKRLEASSDGRADYAEAPAAWWQKDSFSVEFHGHPELNIRPEHLAGPTLFSFDTYDNLSVLCLTALHTGEFDVDRETGLISLEKEDQDRLRAQLWIDPRCYAMGEFAVVIRATDFVLRAKNAIEALDFGYSSTLVDYFDPATFHGQFPLLEMPFRKRNIFSYQNEYRICVDTHTKGDDVIFIDIGDLSDIAVKMPAQDVNAAYRLTFNASDDRA